jgi:hypothetical protein
MRIFDHQDDRMFGALESVQDRPKEDVARRVAGKELPKRRVRSGDVNERAERWRRRERVALAKHDVSVGTTLLDKVVQQRCLADARLTAKQEQTTVAFGRVKQAQTQRFEVTVALQEGHD